MLGAVYVVIFLLSYNDITSAFNDINLVHELGSTMCPYSTFCHKNASKDMQNVTDPSLIPCCFPCYCDDEYLELDNCCPDKDLTDGPRPPLVTCMDPYVKWRSSKPNTNGIYFRVIDSCPIASSEDKTSLISKCNGKNITSLEDYTWVSDKTGKIYRSIHCAKCHGINQTVSWQIRTTCSGIMRANFVNFQEELLSDKCSIINTPPEELMTLTNKYKCFNTALTLSTCNETGRMIHYIPEVHAACEQSTWPYLIEPVLARNAFCMLCNYEGATAIPKLCLSFDTGFKTPANLPFVFLIDYKGIPADYTEKRNRCGTDEIFDEYMGLCRKVSCPIGTAPVNGRCKQLVTEIDGFILSIEFYLENIWNQTSLFTDHDDDTIGNTIFTQFLEILDLSSDCLICQKKLTLVEERNLSSDFILLTSLKFESKCDFSSVLSKISEMRDKVIQIRINDTTALTLLVRSDNPIFVKLNRTSRFVLYHYTSRCQSDEMVFFEDIACPRLELGYLEFELFPLTDIKARNIYASFFTGRGQELNLTKVHVCLDKYFTEMSQLNSALPSVCKYPLYMLPAVIFLLWQKVL